MSSNVLAAKDVNTTMSGTSEPIKGDVKSMEYHRQVLQSKIDDNETKQYISPSDNIMSPCTAKLSAFRNKQVGKVKPKSLFAQASAKKLEGDSLFGKPKSPPLNMD
ncbi:hypothetical protein B0H67DRAFT_576940 [Lasiosphaeris hirsuta]|uniref:Spo12-like protein n=1 Tax=Lasiosphaeris hirsuta TaxID=260670 RepID=A0AA40E1C5_9PEZI|nr:hypothetical protein B0H67DRAFT_576940 [Lasiosphaeris hirsuta]